MQHKYLGTKEFGKSLYINGEKDTKPYNPYNNKLFKVAGYNVLTKVVKIENEDTVEFVKLEEIKIKHDRN